MNEPIFASPFRTAAILAAFSRASDEGAAAHGDPASSFLVPQASRSLVASGLASLRARISQGPAALRTGWGKSSRVLSTMRGVDFGIAHGPHRPHGYARGTTALLASHFDLGPVHGGAADSGAQARPERDA